METVGVLKSTKFITRKEKEDDEVYEVDYAQITLEIPLENLDACDLKFLARRQNKNVNVALEDTWEARTPAQSGQLDISQSMHDAVAETLAEVEPEQAPPAETPEEAAPEEPVAAEPAETAEESSGEKAASESQSEADSARNEEIPADYDPFEGGSGEQKPTEEPLPIALANVQPITDMPAVGRVIRRKEAKDMLQVEDLVVIGHAENGEGPIAVTRNAGGDEQRITLDALRQFYVLTAEIRDLSSYIKVGDEIRRVDSEIQAFAQPHKVTAVDRDKQRVNTPKGYVEFVALDRDYALVVAEVATAAA